MDTTHQYKNYLATERCRTWWLNSPANVQAIEQPSKLQASMEPRTLGRARDNGAVWLRRSQLGFGDGPGQRRRVAAEGETGPRARKARSCSCRGCERAARLNSPSKHFEVSVGA
jgi:hypothetical protein